MPQLTKLEIIDQVLGPYITNPSLRAVEEGRGCVYETSDGRHCAFGACMTPAAINRYKSTIGSVLYLVQDYEGTEIKSKELDKLIQEQYRGHEFYFWTWIQRFHDSHGNFDEKGLSNYGQLSLSHLKLKWKDS